MQDQTLHFISLFLQEGILVFFFLDFFKAILFSQLYLELCFIPLLQSLRHLLRQMSVFLLLRLQHLLQSLIRILLWMCIQHIIDDLFIYLQSSLQVSDLLFQLHHFFRRSWVFGLTPLAWSIVIELSGNNVMTLSVVHSHTIGSVHSCLLLLHNVAISFNGSNWTKVPWICLSIGSQV